jgi:hypothetical protein
MCCVVLFYSNSLTSIVHNPSFGIVELDQTLNFENSDKGLFLRGDFSNMPTFTSPSDPPVIHKFTSTCSSSDFRATLVWHDPPSQTSNSKSLLNDLDILVTSSDGVEIYPNGGTQRDSTNNVESISFKSEKDKEYTVKIYATDIQVGIQPYSYVVTGCFISPDRPIPSNQLSKEIIIKAGIGLIGICLLAGLTLGAYKLGKGRRNGINNTFEGIERIEEKKVQGKGKVRKNMWQDTKKWNDLI